MPRIARILCPIDFSDASVHAVEQAAAIARWSGATLTVLNVEHPIFMPVPTLPPPFDRIPDVRLSAVRERMTAFIRTASMDRIKTTTMVDIGEPVAKILEHVASLPADLVVIGTHGATGFEHLMLGSVTETILRKARCPVLTVPPRARTTSLLPFRRILCAVDFSEWSIEALTLAASLAGDSRAALDVVHVIEWPWDEPPQPDLRELPPAQASALMEFRRYLEVSATKRLEALIRAAVPDTCIAEPHIYHGKPYVELLLGAAEHDADLIVIGVHSHGHVDLALFGSTTNQVVRRATCPVLTLRG